jgi:hypothetical protein
MNEDEEIERILRMSDEEILAEVRAEGRDPEQIAREGRAIFERVLLICARAGVVEHQGARYALTWDEGD